MLNEALKSPVADSAAKDLSPSAARLEKAAAAALAAGLRVDRLDLAAAVADEAMLGEIEKRLFSAKGLKQIAGKVSRIEFFVEGPLPSALVREPEIKREPMFVQTLDYNLCKGCSLCIQVCPKNVYKDDGFGKPDPYNRRPEECTGGYQCGQCTDICPENTLAVVAAQAVFDSTLFVRLPNPYAAANEAAPGRDFHVINPLAGLGAARLPGKLDGTDLKGAQEILDAAGVYPIFTLRGYSRHFVESADPAGDIEQWSAEHGRRPARAKAALELLLANLPKIQPLQEGNYDLDRILNRVLDEVILADVSLGRAEGRDILRGIVADALNHEMFAGARRRPIGGLLPPGTSPAWKTPYGVEIPNYVRVEKCLGPECGLCVTHCPEGGGGTNSALRMICNVPLAAVPAVVRGFKAFLWEAESGKGLETMRDLSAVEPVSFEVDPDYCKACGICISCCPHDVIEPINRSFDLRQGAGQ